MVDLFSGLFFSLISVRAERERTHILSKELQNKSCAGLLHCVCVCVCVCLWPGKPYIMGTKCHHNDWNIQNVGAFWSPWGKQLINHVIIYKLSSSEAFLKCKNAESFLCALVGLGVGLL